MNEKDFKSEVANLLVFSPPLIWLNQVSCESNNRFLKLFIFDHVTISSDAAAVSLLV